MKALIATWVTAVIGALTAGNQTAAGLFAVGGFVLLLMLSLTTHPTKRTAKGG